MSDLIWKAVYTVDEHGNDGEHLWECNSGPFPPNALSAKFGGEGRAEKAGVKINTYDDIDRSRLIQFKVFHPSNRQLPIITVDIKPDYQLIWRKRRWQRDIDSKPFKTVYLIGWHTNIAGKNIASIMYLHENGQIELSDGKSDLELRECEKI